MSFIYKAMDEAKEKIQVNFGFVKKKVYILLIFISNIVIY